VGQGLRYRGESRPTDVVSKNFKEWQNLVKHSIDKSSARPLIRAMITLVSLNPVSMIICSNQATGRVGRQV
jgi:hypothetical protein